jgi:hypothetical protein
MKIKICLKIKNKLNFFKFKKKKTPNLNSNMNNEKIMFTYETHVNDNTSNIVKYIQHNFKDEIQNFVLSHYQ